MSWSRAARAARTRAAEAEAAIVPLFAVQRRRHDDQAGPVFGLGHLGLEQPKQNVLSVESISFRVRPALALRVPH